MTIFTGASSDAYSTLNTIQSFAPGMGADFVSGYANPGVITAVSYDDSELDLDQGIIVIKGLGDDNGEVTYSTGTVDDISYMDYWTDWII